MKVIVDGYSVNVKQQILLVGMDYQQRISTAVAALMLEYINNSFKIPYDFIGSSNIMNDIFPYELSDVRLHKKISSILDRLKYM